MENKPKPISDFWDVVTVLLFICLIGLSFGICSAFFKSCEVKPAEAQTIAYPPNLWMGIIGEAVSEGELGMRAVAHCYKNRLEAGMSLGCVALSRRDLEAFVARQGKKYEASAKKIIEDVFYGDSVDITNSGTHYENIERYGEPYWVKDMIVTAKIGNHTFYRELPKGIKNMINTRARSALATGRAS